MPILDLSLITQTLVKLIAVRVPEMLGQAPALAARVGSVQVSPLAPAQLGGESTIGVHLYHAAEDPHLQNFRPPVPGAPRTGDQPMGWKLFYQVSAHSEMPDKEAAAYREQTLLGLALKAIHDFPVVDTSTQVASVVIFPESLQGADICFRISPLLESPAEAAHLGISALSRHPLVACYQVAVVGSSRRGQ